MNLTKRELKGIDNFSTLPGGVKQERNLTKRELKVAIALFVSNVILQYESHEERIESFVSRSFSRTLIYSPNLTKRELKAAISAAGFIYFDAVNLTKRELKVFLRDLGREHFAYRISRREN